MLFCSALFAYTASPRHFSQLLPTTSVLTSTSGREIRVSRQLAAMLPSRFTWSADSARPLKALLHLLVLLPTLLAPAVLLSASLCAAQAANVSRTGLANEQPVLGSLPVASTAYHIFVADAVDHQQTALISVSASFGSATLYVSLADSLPSAVSFDYSASWLTGGVEQGGRRQDAGRPPGKENRLPNRADAASMALHHVAMHSTRPPTTPSSNKSLRMWYIIGRMNGAWYIARILTFLLQYSKCWRYRLHFCVRSDHRSRRVHSK